MAALGDGSLHRGQIPIYEPELEALVAANTKAGRLKFGTELAKPVAEADAVFIAVGTPSRRGDGHADLSYVHAAAREIAKALSGFTVVVTKSTVPVGTGDEVERIIRETNPGADVVVASNPEFLRDGLEALEGGDLVLKLISPLRPGLIEAADGSGFVYLLMPIRLNV